MQTEKTHLPDPESMSEKERKEEIQFHRDRLKALHSSLRSDWHREFEDALQLDIESWKNGSWVIREYTIGEDAPRIDFIVVSGDKLPDDVKEVFRIFRQKNVIEFKGPGDRITRETIRKVIGYVNFYIGTAKPEESVKSDNVTASIFTSDGNDKLFDELETEGILEKTNNPKIFRVKGMTDIPFQIVVSGELQGKEYAAYRVLRNKVDEKDVEFLLDRIRNTEDPDSRERLRRILNLVELKNAGTVAEKIKEDDDMRDVFMEILKPQIDERIKQRDRINLYSFVQEGGMTVDYAARKAGITVDQFRRDMDEYQKSQENLQPA